MPGSIVAPLVDAHVHVDDERLEPDRARLLRDARLRGIVAQIVPSVSQPLWPRVKAVCAAEADLFACYGLHPCFHDTHQDSHIDELAEWLGREQPVALGECGLDYHVAGADKAVQQHAFAAQLALAREFDLPIVIHARKAVEDVIRMIRASGHYRGLMHSYSGSLQQARRLVDLGYRMSFGGAVTYPRARRLHEVVRSLPIDALLLETDAPDQPGANHTGQRSEPAHLLDTWQSIARLRDANPVELAFQTSRNAIELFNLPVVLPQSSIAPRVSIPCTESDPGP